MDDDDKKILMDELLPLLPKHAYRWLALAGSACQMPAEHLHDIDFMIVADEEAAFLDQFHEQMRARQRRSVPRDSFAIFARMEDCHPWLLLLFSSSFQQDAGRIFAADRSPCFLFLATRWIALECDDRLPDMAAGDVFLVWR